MVKGLQVHIHMGIQLARLLAIAFASLLALLLAGGATGESTVVIGFDVDASGDPIGAGDVIDEARRSDLEIPDVREVGTLTVRGRDAALEVWTLDEPTG